MVDLFVGQHIYRATRQYNGWYVLNQFLTLVAAPLGVVMFLYRLRGELGQNQF